MSPFPNEISFFRENIVHEIEVGATDENIAVHMDSILAKPKLWEEHTRRAQCIAASRYSAFNMIDALISTVRMLRKGKRGLVFSHNVFDTCRAKAIKLNQATTYSIEWGKACSAEERRAWGYVNLGQLLADEPSFHQYQELYGEDVKELKVLPGNKTHSLIENLHDCKSECLRYEKCSGFVFFRVYFVCVLKSGRALKLGKSGQNVIGYIAEHAAPIVATTPSPCYLLVSNLHGWGRYVTREYFHLFNNLLINHGWKYEADLPGWLTGNLTVAKKKKILEMCHGRHPDFILFTEYYWHVAVVFKESITWLRTQGTRVGFWQNDPNVFQFRDMKRKEKLALFEAVDIWYGPYTYSAFVFYPELRDVWPRRVWLPNSVGNELQNLPFNNRPLSRVFVAGHGNP
jgi:hypothetical protein